MARDDDGMKTGSAQTNKSGDPVDQGTRAKGLNYDRGPQDKERGNDGARAGKDKAMSRDCGGHVPNGHGRWK